MKHPSNEDWLSFLYEECSTEQLKSWDRHRQECPQCAQLVDQWRESQRILSKWELAPTFRRYRPAFRPHVWAIAAVALISVAFLFGYSFGISSRLAAPSTTELQQRLHTEIQQAIARYDAEKSTLEAKEIEDQIKTLETLISTQGRSTDLAIAQLHQETAAAVEQIHVQLETVALVGEGRYQQSLNQLSVLGHNQSSLPILHTSHPFNR